MNAMEPLQIAGRTIGTGHPTYVIAELSANHRGRLDIALELVEMAADAGADAVKIQTYRPDTMTLDSPRDEFRIGPGTPWEGRRLYELYAEAQTPWEWTSELMGRAKELGVHFFSSPFDSTAVDFLETLGVPAYKIASFEVVDLALIQRVAATGKPMIMSTGMATAEEIGDAVSAARDAGATSIGLLRCNSAYPASPIEMDLRTLPHMAEAFGVPVGLSDHTRGNAAAVAAVALGGCMIEKHLIDSRTEDAADAAFSLEPHEFRQLVEAVREAEQALGGVRYGPSEREQASLVFRRSLFVVEEVLEGEVFTERSVRAIRPGNGLAPKHLSQVIGRRASRCIPRGTPLTWDAVSDAQVS
jgi:N-acetylneuraminate synthase